jgi:hypothetical protein
MKKRIQNAWRMAKRRAMAANGKTFTERVREAALLGKPVESVKFAPKKTGILG